LATPIAPHASRFLCTHPLVTKWATFGSLATGLSPPRARVITFAVVLTPTMAVHRWSHCFILLVFYFGANPTLCTLALRSRSFPFWVRTRGRLADDLPGDCCVATIAKPTQGTKGGQQQHTTPLRFCPASFGALYCWQLGCFVHVSFMFFFLPCGSCLNL
jgi:hypothetical protein